MLIELIQKLCGFFYSTPSPGHVLGHLHEARTFVFLGPIEDLSRRFRPTVLGMKIPILDRRLIRIPIPAIIRVAKGCRTDTKMS